jgi:aspartate carbamoyltransferase catalytic subunit
MALAGKFKSYSSDWQGLPVPFIRKPLIATSFLENSTRTKHSFAIAIEKLGAKHIDFNAETSSLKKGESLEETLKTLHCQVIDLCIIRTNISEQLAQF